MEHEMRLVIEAANRRDRWGVVLGLIGLTLTLCWVNLALDGRYPLTDTTTITLPVPFREISRVLIPVTLGLAVITSLFAIGLLAFSPHEAWLKDKVKDLFWLRNDYPHEWVAIRVPNNVILVDLSNPNDYGLKRRHFRSLSWRVRHWPTRKKLFVPIRPGLPMNFFGAKNSWSDHLLSAHLEVTVTADTYVLLHGESLYALASFMARQEWCLHDYVCPTLRPAVVAFWESSKQRLTTDRSEVVRFAEECHMALRPLIQEANIFSGLTVEVRFEVTSKTGGHGSTKYEVVWPIASKDEHEVVIPSSSPQPS